ncbi:ABC transporter permease subunit [Kitasatospora sp. NPDC097643]|uniref:ABC transporter permease n=1 Tax=Kitasatospora sp. NPDC097643 TaxID=3157230 RepID=UPI0033286D33
MIWLTWRQHRKQALWTAVLMAVLAAAVIPTGLSMRAAFKDSGLADCLRRLGHDRLATGGDCQALSQRFDNQYGAMPFLAILFLLLPLLVGLFLGAPLVAREVENGTHRLIWTQGISRRRWIVTKFGLVGGAALVLSVVYAVGVSWWFQPLADNGLGRFRYLVFDLHGTAPIGYTLFAVALGILVGTVCRKVLPAMGISLVAFVAVRALVELLARPSYLPAKSLTYPIDSPVLANRFTGDWVRASGLRNGTGELVMPDAQIGCAQDGTEASARCVADLSQQGFGPGPYTNWQEYQPADRFWTFQAIETGIFLALTALLLFLAVRRIRRIA